MTQTQVTKTVEELLLNLLRTREYNGDNARLLLVHNNDIVRVADSTSHEEYEALRNQTDEIEHSRSIHALYSAEELDALKLPGWNAAEAELEAKFPKAETDAMVKAAGLAFITKTKRALIDKIKVLMARGYTPVGVIGTSCDSQYIQSSTAGYLPDAEASRTLSAFFSGFMLNYIDRELDLGTVERAKRDLEIA